MTIFRIERLSPIETQKHCISNSLKYNASLHFNDPDRLDYDTGLCHQRDGARRREVPPQKTLLHHDPLRCTGHDVCTVFTVNRNLIIISYY